MATEPRKPTRSGEHLSVLRQLFAQLVHHRDLADVVEPDGRVVQPEPPGRHDGVQERGELVVVAVGDVEVGKRGP